MATKIKRKAKPSPRTAALFDRVVTLIDEMLRLEQTRKSVENEWNEVRAELGNHLTDEFNDSFVHTTDEYRYSGQMIRPESVSVSDSILEDLTPEVRSEVTDRRIDNDLLLNAVAAGLIAPEVVAKITVQVIDSVRLNAAIELGKIPSATVKKHTIIKASKPYPKVKKEAK